MFVKKKKENEGEKTLAIAIRLLSHQENNQFIKVHVLAQAFKMVFVLWKDRVETHCRLQIFLLMFSLLISY